MRLKYIPANGAPLAAALSDWIAKPTPKRNENIATNFLEMRKSMIHCTALSRPPG